MPPREKAWAADALGLVVLVWLFRALVPGAGCNVTRCVPRQADQLLP